MKFLLYLTSLLSLIFAILFIGIESLPFVTLPYLNHIFKPLTMVTLISLSLLSLKHNRGFYPWSIAIGLFFSMWGDICLMWPKTAFLWGLLIFLLAHFCYIFAFKWKTQLKISLLFSCLLLGVATGFFLWLRPSLGAMQIPVLIYTLILSSMVWMAYHRWRALKNLSGLLAFVGAMLFMGSDMSLAIQHFRGDYSGAVFLIFGTYFTGQYLIALSTHTGTNLKK